MSKPKILIVDDERLFLNIIVDLLKNDYETFTATNGKEALEYTKSESIPDLILLDIVLPDMNGFEICQKLKESNHTQDIPIIFLTIKTDVDDETRGFETGAIDYITKPISPAILKARVKTHIALMQAHKKLAHHAEELEGIVSERTRELTNEIEERKTIESQLRFLANYDLLTNLPNRILFREHLDQSIKQSYRNKTSVALLLIDIDGFKHINDSLGHHQGDLLLQIVADRLNKCIRDVDQVARLGGDEFTVILAETTDKKSAALVAEKIIKTVSEPIQLERQKVYISASVGITLLPEDTNDPSILLGYADMAMYEAKAKGKNAYEFYTPRLLSRVHTRVDMEKELHKALGSNQLEVYYQPIFKTQHGELHGAEALIRWKHPERGFIPPIEFIPIAEDSDLILKLGKWVLEEVVKTASFWNKLENTDEFHIAVNMSSRQFQNNGSCIELVNKCLSEFDLPPHLLKLEITESLMMEDRHNVINKLNELKKMGVGLSIDDFGTGYSSLSYIRRFPINTIKIDKSFIHDITLDSDDASLITAIIAMAKSLGMNVVAEGVETAEQYRFLQDHDCDFVQGYYFCKPVPREKFESDFLSAVSQTAKLTSLQTMPSTAD
jgi:diguanylate cyclase (GGDEF)-like protein